LCAAEGSDRVRFPVVFGGQYVISLEVVCVEHALIVGSFILLASEFLVREPDILHPPVLTPARHCPHVMIKVGAEHVVEIRLAEFNLVNQVARFSNGKAACNAIRQAFGEFRLEFS
jgi:hypothetical protein